MVTLKQLERLEAHKLITTYTDQLGGSYTINASFSAVEYLTLGDRNIAYRFVGVNGMPPHISVAGIKASKVYATRTGVSAIDVEMVPESEQAQVREQLARILGFNKDEIKFWS